MSVADIDNDGKDEILSGSLALDNDLTPLWSSYKGHGDAQHLANYDPTHKGMEYFVVHETFPFGATLYDAKNGKTLFHTNDSIDTGRGMMANVGYTDGFFEIWTFNGSYKSYSSFGNKNIKSENYTPISTNFRIFWDGDLYDDLLDGDENDNIIIDNKNGRIATLLNTKTNNGSKQNPCLTADIFGDWREEIITKSSDENKLLIYTTTIPTKHKLYTLMHDRAYRMQVASQNVGYNQPPHISYYINENNNKYDERKTSCNIKTKINNKYIYRNKKTTFSK